MQKKEIFDTLQNVCSTLVSLPGVFNASIVQSDGYPLAISGLWLSKNEVFDLGAIVSAITAAASRLTQSLEYILLEGFESKIAIFNVIPNKVILSSTMSFDVNLGALLVSIRKIKQNINSIEKWIEEYIYMPLIEFNENERQEIISRQKVHNLMKRTASESSVIEKNNISLSSDMYSKLNEILLDFRKSIPHGEVNILVITQAGQQLYPLNFYNPFLGPFVNSIFDISKKMLRFFRQDDIRQLTLSYSSVRYFVFDLRKGILLISVSAQSPIKTGLIRFLGSALSSKIENVLAEAEIERSIPLEININDFF